jgi:hypothetical protein
MGDEATGKKTTDFQELDNFLALSKTHIQQNARTMVERKSDAPDLIAFMQDIGIPATLHSNDANKLTQGKMAETAHAIVQLSM